MLIRSLVHRLLPREGRGPGIQCLCMCETIPGFCGIAVTSSIYYAESSGQGKTKSSGRRLVHIITLLAGTVRPWRYRNPIKIWDNHAHVQKVYTRCSPLVWKGPGYKVSSPNDWTINKYLLWIKRKKYRDCWKSKGDRIWCFRYTGDMTDGRHLRNHGSCLMWL